MVPLLLHLSCCLSFSLHSHCFVSAFQSHSLNCLCYFLVLESLLPGTWLYPPFFLLLFVWRYIFSRCILRKFESISINFCCVAFTSKLSGSKQQLFFSSILWSSCFGSQCAKLVRTGESKVASLLSSRHSLGWLRWLEPHSIHIVSHHWRLASASSWWSLGLKWHVCTNLSTQPVFEPCWVDKETPYSNWRNCKLLWLFF